MSGLPWAQARAQAALLGERCALVAGQGAAVLYERHGELAIAIERIEHPHADVVALGPRAIALVGETDPLVLWLGDHHIQWVTAGELTLPENLRTDPEALAAAAGFAAPEGVELRRTALISPVLDDRQGPEAVQAALGSEGQSFQNSAGRCLCLLATDVPHVRQVAIGDDAGVRPTEPALIGGSFTHDFVDDRRSLVCMDGGSYLVDHIDGTARGLIELPIGSPGLDKLVDDGLCLVVEEHLVIWEDRDGIYQPARTVYLGPGGDLIATLLDGRVVALRTDRCRLVLLAVRGTDVWLLAGAAPADAIWGRAELRLVQNPPGYWRLMVEHDQERLALVDLERAWERCVANPPDIADALPARPWGTHGIGVRSESVPSESSASRS